MENTTDISGSKAGGSKKTRKGKSIVAHRKKHIPRPRREHSLKRFFGTWKGNDALEMLELVKNSRSRF